MAKNKEALTQKRKQASAAKDTERRKTNRKKREAETLRLKKSKVVPPVGSSEPTKEQFSDEQEIWWRCNGVNFIISDHDQGIWTPLFPEIYTENGGTLPELSTIAERVVGKYSEFTEWPLEGKAALGWTIQSRSVIFVYFKEALRRLAARHPDGNAEELCKLPHDPVIWGLFNFLKEHLLPSKVKKAAHEKHA